MFSKKAIVLCYLSFFLWVTAFGQETDKQHIILKDSLIRLGYEMYNEPNEPERLQSNYRFIQTLVTLLKTPRSFEMDLDTLNMISIKKPLDRKFRIFSWHLPLNDGSYRYYGAIQLHTANGSLQLLPLVDYTPDITEPNTAVLDNNHWYGAQYYDLISLKGLPNHYILLGWKGTNPKIMQKVIDILWIKDQNIHFGKPLFVGKGVNPKSTRMVYKYNKQVSMLLKSDQKHEKILMDHLAPSDPKLKGEYQFYGPDMSYDAWEIRKNKLFLVEDLPLKNDEGE